MSHSPADESSAPAVAGGPRPATENSLRSLLELGQSLWLDDLRRSLFTSGEFSRLIAEDGLRGVTSNPSIFERALADGTEYQALLRNINRTDQINPAQLYEVLTIGDIRDAADLLRPLYDLTQPEDGYASLEVSPYVAYDTQATIAEARRLWHAIGRDNVMIDRPRDEASSND
jgi:transaldolase / glucose-6-phosphate isomerase